MRFSVALSEELSKHSPRENRAKVASKVYSAMVERGFKPAIVNDRGFEDMEKDKPRRTYWMRRNNGIDCWEVA